MDGEFEAHTGLFSPDDVYLRDVPLCDEYSHRVVSGFQ